MKEKLSSLSLIHYAMLAGQLVMLGVMLFLKRSYSMQTNIGQDTFLLIVPAMCIIAYYLGNRIYTSRYQMVSKAESEEEAMNIYRSAVIIRLALIEGVTLFAIMAYYLSGNFLYIIISVILLAYFYVIRPMLTDLEKAMRNA